MTEDNHDITVWQPSAVTTESTGEVGFPAQAPASPEPHAAEDSGSGRDLVTTVLALGAVAAGVALFEVALVPGILVGGAAFLAPRLVPRLRRGATALYESAESQVSALISSGNGDQPAANGSGLSVRQAAIKTITFRTTVTALDFSANYLVLGEVMTAAGLSIWGLVSAPIFYFAHEVAWNRYGKTYAVAELDGGEPIYEIGGFKVRRALAKTATYRAVATVAEFTASFVVTGDLATAALLSSFGLVLGPFVYYFHEVAWHPRKAIAGGETEAAKPAMPESEPAMLALPAPAGA